MPRSFAVDTDIISFLERSGQLTAVAALGRLPAVITDQVWIECSAGPGGADRVKILSAWVGGATPIVVSSPEARTVSRLYAQGDLEMGEISAIAWAIHHPEVIPVLHERQAIFRAIEELRGRPVLSFHGFLGELRDQHGLSNVAAARISAWFCGSGGPQWKNGVRPVTPMWW